MRPGSKDDGSKQEVVSEAIVGIVAAVVEAKEAMVTAVEMLEYLELGNKEADRVAAARYFSRALGDYKGLLPPHSPGHLPCLLQRLKDCLGGDRTRTIQNEAILSINRLIYHYAHISEPTETEMASLDAAIDALDYFIKTTSYDFYEGGPDFRPISPVLPTILSIYQEPGKRKKAQLHAATCLANLARRHSENETTMMIDSSVMKVLMETARVGKASPNVQLLTIFAISEVIKQEDYNGHHNLLESSLKSGILDVIEQVLKHPNHVMERKIDWDAWTIAAECLKVLSAGFLREQVLGAILSSGGLMEHLLEMGQGRAKHQWIGYSTQLIMLMKNIANAGTESQLRRLMSKASFFRFLANHLNAGPNFWSNWPNLILNIVKACLETPGTEHEIWLRRRLIDDSGITDAVRRISLGDPYPWDPSLADQHQAHHIFDTYLKDPLPPRPISKLPSVISTKNVPQ